MDQVVILCIALVMTIFFEIAHRHIIQPVCARFVARYVRRRFLEDIHNAKTPADRVAELHTALVAHPTKKVQGVRVPVWPWKTFVADWVAAFEETLACVDTFDDAQQLCNLCDMERKRDDELGARLQALRPRVVEVYCRLVTTCDNPFDMVYPIWYDNSEEEVRDIVEGLQTRLLTTMFHSALDSQSIEKLASVRERVLRLRYAVPFAQEVERVYQAMTDEVLAEACTPSDALAYAHVIGEGRCVVRALAVARNAHEVLKVLKDYKQQLHLGVVQSTLSDMLAPYFASLAQAETRAT
jgi:hypothetical protein